MLGLSMRPDETTASTPLPEDPGLEGSMRESLTASNRRRGWEESWASSEGHTFLWWTEEVPRDFFRALDFMEVPAGRALDVGCGDGVITMQLAEHFAETVGVDFAVGAIRRAVARVGRDDTTRFLVSDALRLPFRDGMFTFVFDRGCLQMLPRELYDVYFSEMSRVLRQGGVLQIFISKERKDPRALLSRRGHRTLFRWLRGRAFGPQFVNQQFLEGLAAGRMRMEVIEKGPYRPPGGTRRRTMLNAVFVKP